MDSGRIKGKMKQWTGRLTRNKDAVADGRSEAARGKAKDKARDVKDKIT